MASTDLLDPALFAALERAEGRCELVEGEIVEMTPTGFEHARVVSQIAFLLKVHARQSAGLVVIAGEPGFIWDGKNVRAPDVAVIARADAVKAPERGFMPFAPLLAIEVVSPNDSWQAVHMKATGWLAHGAKSVWVVDPLDRLVVVYRVDHLQKELRQADLLADDPALPGFSCQVDEFFEG